jgi:hypothetical protein
VKERKKAEAAAAAAAGGAQGAAAVAARPNPKEWYDQHHAKYKESAFTTGATARAFTSTVAVATTKSERQLQRVDRNPTKKGESSRHVFSFSQALVMLCATAVALLCHALHHILLSGVLCHVLCFGVLR